MMKGRMAADVDTSLSELELSNVYDGAIVRRAACFSDAFDGGIQANREFLRNDCLVF